VAVCGRDRERTGRFAEKYGVEPFTDIRDMISRSGIRALCICTPHPAHAAVAVPALSMGVHVLVEKPLASSLSDCDDILDAAKAGGGRVGTVCQRRWYAPTQRVRKAIDEGKLGKPILGTVLMYGWRDAEYYASDSWRGKWSEEGGGVLVNQAPHQLDLLQWFMGPVDELFGFWDNFNHPYIEVEDTALAVLRFKSGGLGHICVSNSQNPALYGTVHVHGSNGASVGVQTDGGAMFIAGMSEIKEPPINDLWTVRGEEEQLKRWQEEDAAFFLRINAVEYYHRLQIQDFLHAVLEGREPLITGEEGRKTVEIFTAIYRSQRDHAPVKFPLKT
jgi:predicted dehydrogenase